MIIRIEETSYLVLGTVPEDGLCQYVCKKQDGTEGEYRAVRVPSALVSGELIQYLMEQVHKESFHEFVDYATDAEGLYVIMDCGRGILLSQRMKTERMSLRERLETGRRILERLVISDFPDYFIHAAVLPDAVRLTPAMDVSFAFHLGDLDHFAEYDFGKAQEALAVLMETLFEKELSIQSFPDMSQLIRKLRAAEKENLLEVYEEYSGIDALWRTRNEEHLENRSWPFRIWGWMKSLGRILKKLAAVFLVCLAVLYLVLSVQAFFREPEPGVVYERIGDLEIINHQEPEE